MAKVILSDGQAVRMKAKPGLSMIIPGPGITVKEIVNHKTITNTDTLERVKRLSLNGYLLISLPDSLIRQAFEKVSNGDMPWPAPFSALQDAATDTLHLIGLFILIYEALIEKKHIYLDHVDAPLHPRQQRLLTSGLKLFLPTSDNGITETTTTTGD